LPKQIIGRDTKNDRPLFRPEEYYNFDVNHFYTRIQQQDTLEELLGSRSLAESYVEDTGDTYMVRGHLSPNADFVYYAMQDSTFFYIDVAPQWQDFNAGNWLAIENAVRHKAENFVSITFDRSLLAYVLTVFSRGLFLKVKDSVYVCRN